MKLSLKQIHAANEYIKTGNKEQALLSAGYSKSYARGNAHKMFANVSIKSYIEEQMSKIESDKIADAKEVLEFYTKVLRGEEQETVVVATKLDVEEVDKTPDLKTRLAAAKELIKRYPGNDRLQDAQFRKLDAEARIVGNKADKLTNNSQDNDLLSALSDVINGGDDSNETDVQSETDGEH